MKRNLGDIETPTWVLSDTGLIILIEYDNSGFQVVNNHKGKNRTVDLADDIWL